MTVRPATCEGYQIQYVALILHCYYRASCIIIPSMFLRYSICFSFLSSKRQRRCF
ncbi:hypothetical protein BCR43DRAFT_499798 [Syncephalastrum racemosum]|uniref:Uncharacterized protein n=1 Tax=Syncephalastrum racemosum TaxID=13706 RepID=A0A1X2GZL8_SYNRA|nr:hypothetical protein BCR43DRAFT_499798 [Syncephalastrum racemosum]